MNATARATGVPYFISEIPEFVLPKFRNFRMYKRPEIPEFGNSGIAITTSLLSIAYGLSSLVVGRSR